MALAPRNPDLKDNLDVTYGTFGTLVGFGTLGAFVALMTVGHVIHKVGTFPIMLSSTFLMAATFLVLANTTSPAIFFIANILCGTSWSSYHISVNTQTIHRQNELGINAVPHLHGIWTAGAVSSALLASFIADSISLAWHINTLTLIVGSVMVYTIFRLRPICIPARDVKDEDGAIGFIEMIKSFRIDWILTGAYISVIILEISLGDWSTLFNRDVIGVKKGTAVIPYIVFMSAMIIGRIGFNRVMRGREEYRVLRAFAFAGGLGFTLSLLLATWSVEYSKDLAFTLVIIGFFFGGLGSSFLGPYFFSFAASRSDRPGSIALAEVSATNTALTFIYKLFLAWVAQVAGLTVALLIPGLLLLSAAFYIRRVLQRAPQNS